ncbi:tetratricopeptide repeat protein [Blastopirellula sp. JC732]|uniref:Tetratricopeptide repeat protein n=1 Tax=Blastopirellula sediminis TaxID=2894196 RepID=A0A9X1MSQ9_9BACT|nr:CHAT domain-containing protein [Blastopirellula sediminis]MCC9604985.1 tetratricopeptide repeat protein [Blastopirellula sediminis]MCC9631715.1 tetratricopeptide repeat protein [Blastopirellula sediminis]
MAVFRAVLFASACLLLMLSLLFGAVLLRSERATTADVRSVASQSASSQELESAWIEFEERFGEIGSNGRSIRQFGFRGRRSRMQRTTAPQNNTAPAKPRAMNSSDESDPPSPEAPVDLPDVDPVYPRSMPRAVVNQPENSFNETQGWNRNDVSQEEIESVQSVVAKDRADLLLKRSASNPTKDDDHWIEELRFLDSADLLAQYYESKERFADCLAVRQEMRKLAIETWGEDHWRSVEQKEEERRLKKISAFSLGERLALRQLEEAKTRVLELHSQGKDKEAIADGKAAVASAARLFGKEDLSYATALHNLGVLYLAIGNSTFAKTNFEQSLETYRKMMGESHPRYASGLSSLGGLHYTTGEYEQAERLFQETLAIQRACLSEDDPEYLKTRNNLGLLYQRIGNYDDAIALTKETFELRKATLGEEDSHVISSRNNLANAYLAIGDYDNAEALYQENVDVAKQNVGETHPDYARCLHNLGSLYEAKGQLLLAEPLYRQSLDIWTKAYDESHPHIAKCQVNLGSLHQKLGNFPQAETYFQAAVKNQRSLLGEEHPDYANSLNALGHLYWKTERYAEAKATLEKGAAILSAALGEQHPDYAACLDSLASVERDTGEYLAAEKLYLQSRQIIERQFGKTHPSYAERQNNLGVLYRRMGKFDQAEPLLLEALEIREKVCGEEHPGVAETVFELARLYHLQNDLPKATARYQQAYDLTARHVDVSSAILTEPQQLALNQLLVERLYGLLSIVQAQHDQFPAAYAAVLRWKGAAMVRQRAIRRVASESDSAELFQSLQQTTRLWTALAHANANEPVDKERTTRLAALANERQSLERELAQQSAEFRALPGAPSHAAIAAALPADVALLDYLEYVHSQPDPNDAGKLVATRRLIGFLIQHDGPPMMVDLGPIAPVEQAVDDWRQSFGTSPDGIQAGKALRSILIQPFDEQLAQKKTLIISPDGVLGRIPFAAVPGKEDGAYLLEDFRLTTAPAPRLLADTAAAAQKRPSKDLLLMGGIDYDHRQEPKPATNKPSAGRFRGTEEQLRSLTRGYKWSYLPGTEGEVAFIKTLYVDQLQVPENLVALYTQERATEELFRKNAGDCFVLHLATHGYFVPAEAVQNGAATDSERFERRAEYGAGLLSGIVFAGANKPPELSADDGDALADDGYLTADEISTLPLFGVKLVVLSACDTGLGEIAGGEGILGIQRAFQISGVDATIASYWKIDDLVTRRLMEEFYKNYLREQMSPVDALREAQLWVLKNPNQLRGATIVPEPGAEETNERTPPRYWAAFSLSGLTE